LSISTGGLFRVDIRQTAGCLDKYSSPPGGELRTDCQPSTHIIAPLTLYVPSKGSSSYGYGVTELGIKFRFVQEREWLPQIGTFPLLEVLSESERNLENQKLQTFLPIWLQKSTGKWTTYGGGWYWINPGSQNRNCWFTGIVIQRQVFPNLAPGLEIFHGTSQQAGQSAETGLNLGIVWGLVIFSTSCSLLIPLSGAEPTPRIFRLPTDLWTIVRAERQDQRKCSRPKNHRKCAIRRSASGSAGYTTRTAEGKAKRTRRGIQFWTLALPCFGFASPYRSVDSNRERHCARRRRKRLSSRAREKRSLPTSEWCATRISSSRKNRSRTPYADAG
jgi:hypothetical protein